MTAAPSSETPVNSSLTTRNGIQDDSILQSHRPKHLKTSTCLYVGIGL